jgi:hypothetical protein
VTVNVVVVAAAVVLCAESALVDPETHNDNHTHKTAKSSESLEDHNVYHHNK